MYMTNCPFQTMGSDGDGGTNRSEILSRISKMGQSMLPVAPSTESTEVSVAQDVF